MAQGRQAVYDLLEGKVSWPPVVVPFGLDPFGWHGERESYRKMCEFALEHCTLFPKVYPFNDPLAIGQGDIEIVSDVVEEIDGTIIQRYEIIGAKRVLSMEEVQTPGDSSWKNRKRWIENDDDFELFLGLHDITPAEPDIQAVRKKEQQVGGHGLPYIETPDPFYTACEMFPTDEFFIKIRTDTERIERLISITAERILYGIEKLCREAECPFILRLIGAEIAAPPFMSRENFLHFDGAFYMDVAEITRKHGVPASFHSHGPVRDIMNDVWEMGYSFMEPFEPLPNGNVTIEEAIEAAKGRGIVFGGVDDVVLNTGTPEKVRNAVKCCLDDARDTRAPYILSQSSTPFSDPLGETAKANYLLFLELGIKG
ncbi:MAG: hypothetical protein HOC71_02475 [Candidatus Latescibacteria bacterium]|jgi:hypothetical protein|nr:hypothetical protein [Candidatus Latescibacterota bacterium]